MSIIRLISPNVREAKISRPPEGRRDFLKLDLNENPDVLDEAIMEKIRGLDAFTVGCYPECRRLLPALARYAGVPEDHLLLTNGSAQGIQLAIELFFHAGDAVAVPSPTFPLYCRCLDAIGSTVRTVPYTEADGRFRFPAAATLAALDSSARGLVLCNPNNPLGDAIPPADLRTLAERTRALDIPIIIDEAYREYAADETPLKPGEYPNLITLRTFSKAFGLAGLRLGYVIAAPEIIAEMGKTMTPRSVNHLAILAGEAVLERLPYFQEKLRGTVEVRRRLAERLTAAGVRCYPSQTNFIVCRHPDQAGIIARLKANGVLVSDISRHPHSDGLLEDSFRVTVPSAADFGRFDRALAAALTTATQKTS